MMEQKGESCDGRLTIAPSWALHPLKGELKGHWAISVNGNWRMVFTFEGKDAVLVDYLDYH